MKRLALVPIILSLLLPTCLFGADAEVGASIAFAYGDEVSIQSGSSFRSLKIGKDAVIGQAIKQGDLVQTGPGTILEIQFKPSGTIMKMAENSSVRITDLSQGKGNFEVLYGRIRNKVAALTATESFQVKSSTAVAGVRGTDFGFDVLIVPGAAKVLQSQVYCFEGSVAVTTAAGASEEPVLIQANQIIVIVPLAATSSVKLEGGESQTRGEQSMILSKVIPEAIQQYWDERTKLETKVEEAIKAEALNPTAPSALSTPRKAANPADQIPPLPSFSAIQSMSKEQYIYGPDWKKQSGMVVSNVGIATLILSGLVGSYGFEMMGLDSTTARTIGQWGVLSGLSATFVGTGLFAWGFLER